MKFFKSFSKNLVDAFFGGEAIDPLDLNQDQHDTIHLGFFDRVANIFTSLTEVVDDMNGHGEPSTEEIPQFAQNVTYCASTTWSKLQEFLKHIWNVLSEKVTSAAHHLYQMLTSIVGRVWNWFSSFSPSTLRAQLGMSTVVAIIIILALTILSTWIMSPENALIYMPFIQVLIGAAMLFLSTNHKMSGLILTIVGALQVLYRPTPPARINTQVVQVTPHALPLSTPLSSAAFVDTDMKEDMSTLFSTLVGGSVLCTALLAGVSLASFTKGDFGQMLYNVRTVGQAKFQWSSQIMPYFTELWDNCVGFVYKYVIGKGYVDETEFDEIKQICAVHARMTSLEFRAKIGTNIETAYEVIALFRRHLSLKAKYVHNGAVMKVLNTMDSSIKTMYEQVINRTPLSAGMRMEPVALALLGDAGVGKTLLTQQMIVPLLKLVNKYRANGDPMNEVYLRSVEQEFWDGYMGQSICLYDDFAQLNEVYGTPNMEWFEYVRGTNHYSYPLHMASLESKGSTYFNCDYMILTSNLEQFNPKNMVSSTAFTRRLTLTLRVEVIKEVQRQDGTSAATAVSYHKLNAWRKKNNLPNWDTSHYILKELDPDTMKVKSMLSFKEMLSRISAALAMKHNEFIERKEAMKVQETEELPDDCIKLTGDKYGPDTNVKVDGEKISDILKQWTDEDGQTLRHRQVIDTKNVEQEYIAKLFKRYAPNLQYHANFPVYLHLLHEYVESEKKNFDGTDFATDELEQKWQESNPEQRLVVERINSIIKYCHTEWIVHEKEIKELQEEEKRSKRTELEKDVLGMKGKQGFKAWLFQAEEEVPIQLEHLGTLPDGSEAVIPTTISRNTGKIHSALGSRKDDALQSSMVVTSGLRMRVLKMLKARREENKLTVPPENIHSFMRLASRMYELRTGKHVTFGMANGSVVNKTAHWQVKSIETLLDFVDSEIRQGVLKVEINENLSFGGYYDEKNDKLSLSPFYVADIVSFNGYENARLEEMFEDARRQEAYSARHNLKKDIPTLRVRVIQYLNALKKSCEPSWNALKPWKNVLAIVAGMIGIGTMGVMWYYHRPALPSMDAFTADIENDAKTLREVAMQRIARYQKERKEKDGDLDDAMMEKIEQQRSKLLDKIDQWTRKQITKYHLLEKDKENSKDYAFEFGLILEQIKGRVAIEAHDEDYFKPGGNKKDNRRLKRDWFESTLGSDIMDSMNENQTTSQLVANIASLVKKSVAGEASPSNQGSELMTKVSANMMTASVVADLGNGVQSEKKLANVFFITDRIMFYNRHFLFLIADYAETKKATGAKILVRLGYTGNRAYTQGMGIDIDAIEMVSQSKDFVVNGEPTDFMVCEVKSVVPFANMVKHLPDKKQLDSLYAGANIGMATWRRTGNVIERVYQTGNFRGFNDISMALKSTALKDEEGVYSGVGETSISSLPGDCGGVYVVLEDQFPDKFVGLHFGGCKGGGSTFMPLCKEYVRDLVKKAIPQQDPLKEVETQGFSVTDDEFPMEGNFIPKFSISETIFNPTKSRWRKSLMYDQVIRSEVGPSWLEPALAKDGPMFKGLMKNSGHIPAVNGRAVEMAIESYKRLLSRRGVGEKGHLCRTLSWKEAIEGIPGDDGFNPVNRTKSPGFPFMMPSYKRRKKVEANGKQHWLGYDEWTWNNTPEGKELLDMCMKIEEVAKKQVPFVMFVDTLKDEKRSMEKIAQKKTRTFAAAPMDFTIVFRKYFGGFLAHMFHNRVHLESCIGVDVHTEWNLVAKKLNYFGKNKRNIFAGDFSNYDGTMNAHIFPRIIEIINWWYSASEGSLESKKEANTIRENLWKAVCFSHHIVGNIVYQWTHGQPSGNPSTAISNSIYNSLVMRYAFYNNPELQGMHFNAHVSMIVYGDDNAGAVSDEARAFNAMSISKQLASIGMTYTDEAKTGEQLDFRYLREITFLKRGFVWCDTARQYMAPLALRSILEMTNWVSSTLAPNEALRLNCEAAVRELYFHDEDTFDEWYSKISTQLLKHCHHHLTAFSWEQARRKIAAGETWAVLSPTSFSG